MVKKTSRKMANCTGGTETPVSHQLVQLFWMLGPAFMRWAESHMREQGTTPQRISLMALLVENGPMMMSSLRNALGVTATNITALVDALEKDKMVTRRAHPKDRRITMIALTPKAEKQIAEQCPKFKDRMATLFSGFSAKEKQQLLGMLHHMKDELIKRRILKESELCKTPGKHKANKSK